MNKLEEVARALFMRSSGNDGTTAEPGDHWAEADQDVRDSWKELALAAIEAMREPTPEMMWAMDYNEVIDCTLAWEIGIDAALKEQP